MAALSNIQIVLRKEVIELQALITEREGMIAENKYREMLGQSIAYNKVDFNILAEKIRDLKDNLV